MHSSIHIARTNSGLQGLTVVAARILLYRSARLRPTVSSFEDYVLFPTPDISVRLSWDKASFAREHAPLRHHFNVLCIATNPFRWVQMDKTGRTPRGYRPLTDDFFQLVEILFADIARFPRGFQPYFFDSEDHAITSMALKEKCQ